jgi:DNA-binding NarL/FixJ family response regulator
MNDAKIFIVDDHPLVREWLTNLIRQHPGLVVCGEAATAAEAVSGIANTKPDVAIVDISLRNGSGLDLIKTLKAMHPGTAIIVLSMHDERLYAERSLRAGARGYIMKRETTRNVIAAIRQVLDGKLYVSSDMAAYFAEKFVDGKPPTGESSVEQLSDRELEVFQFLGQGRETRDIAKSLNISIKTVQAYCARIKEKLKLANASELLREAVRWYENRAGL